MPQILRPIANITQTLFTGGYAEIDEAVASDADKAYGSGDDAVCTLEVKLSAAEEPRAGAATCRFRYVKTDISGVVQSNNENPTLQAFIYQGATLIASDAVINPASAVYATRAWNPDLSAVTDWSDLRLRFVVGVTVGGGSRSAAISWAELEIPDPPTDDGNMFLAIA